MKTNLLFNKSKSLPHRVYFLIKQNNFKKGDLVGIRGFQTQYTTDKHFTKRIIGIPHDHIRVFSNYVFINGKRCAMLKEKTKNNDKLTPIASQEIPKHYYFVIAENNDSFDSRYQEFGLVKDDYIEGKAIPLW